jgi:hypothetical protein
MPAQTANDAGNAITAWLSGGGLFIAIAMYTIKTWLGKQAKQTEDIKKLNLQNSTTDVEQTAEINCLKSKVVDLTKRLERLESLHMNK